MAPENVVNKIRAILRKAEEGSGATEEEADAALKMANKLLFKYGLEMADIGDLNDDPGREFGKGQVLVTEGDLDHWKGLLLARIGAQYFCKVYYTSWSGDRQRRWYIVGRHDYVQATLAMFEFVQPQIESDLTVALSRMTQNHRYARKYAEGVYTSQTGEYITEDTTDEQLASAAKERFERIKSEHGPDAAVADIQHVCNIAPSYAAEVRAKVRKEEIAPSFVSNVGIYRRSFTDAASAVVSRRLRAMMKKEEKDAGSAGTELVVNEKGALDKYMEEIGLKLQSFADERQWDGSGVQHGRTSGNNADLSGHSKLRGQGGALGSGK